MTRIASAVLALALVLAACSSDPAPGDAATGPPSTPGQAEVSRSPSPADTSVTSAPLATPTDDPFEPTGTRFAGRVVDPLPRWLASAMRGETWERGCPAPLDDLALLNFNYWDLDGDVQRGPMVVNAAVAEDVLGVFRTLFRARFPLARVALATRFRPNADPDSRVSVTASFNCRPVVTPDGPGNTFSEHAYGLAVDVNSLQNPYVREDGFTRNRFARPYVDRSQDLPGMIHQGDVVVRAFAAIGWEWGGNWDSGHDYMHFSLNGR